MSTLLEKMVTPPVKLYDLACQIHLSIKGKDYVAREVHGHCPEGKNGLTLKKDVTEVLFTASKPCTLRFFDEQGNPDADFFGTSSVDLDPLPHAVRLTIHVDHGDVHFRPENLKLGKHSVKMINNPDGDTSFTGNPDPIIKPE